MDKTTIDPKPFLEKNKIPYKLIISGSTQKILSEMGNYVFRPDFIRKKDFMYVFKHVNDRANKVMEKPEKLGELVKPKFIHLRKFWGNSQSTVLQMNDLFSIDICSAYWKIAHEMGLSSDKVFSTFNGAKDERKLLRNMSIGNLAKKTIIFNVDENGNKKFIKSDVNPNSKCYWKVAEKCDEQININKDSLGGNYLFSWVDNFYLLGKSSVNHVQSNLKKDGFDSTVKTVKKIIRKNNLFFVYYEGIKQPKKYCFYANLKERMK